MKKIFQRLYIGRDMDILSLRLCLLGLTNALAVFMDLMNRVCKPHFDKFFIVIIDDILIYSKSKEDHEAHLKLVLELWKKEKLFAKFSKCEFWLREIHFLRHVVNSDGIRVDSSKIEVMKNWKVPKTPSEIRSFLGLAGSEDFVVYCDVSNQGLGYVLMQRSKRHYFYGTKNVIYTDHKSLQHIFDQKELNMHQRRRIELFSDCECEIRYHPGKANIVANALSRKERVKPRRVRAMAMTIQSGVKRMILVAQSNAFKEENVPAERLHGLDQQIERKEDESLYFMDRIWVPLVGGVRTIIMDKAHKTRYFVHPGADKIYHDLREMYWWPDVAKALGTRLDMSTAYHPQTDGQSEQTIQTLEDMLRAYGIHFGSSWDTHLSLAESPVLWAEIGENRLIGPELVQETTDKVVLIKKKLKAARDCQKSYADNRRKPLEFEVGDQVLLKVSPWKGVIHFGKKDKLAPRFPEELSSVQDTFHVSNLKKCLANANMHVPLDEIKVDKTLCFIEEPIEIMDREVKSLKRSKILIVKVCWNSKRGPELTWEREDHMRAKYP
ncbi:putative reverse transcriptase domain-containing protein [Tanacetum coccineum]